MATISAKPQGVWAWILQRITAVLLILFLGTHIAVLHYVPENLSINFVGVAMRFKSLLYVVVDSSLLAVGLYHALNGVRNVLFDYIIKDGTRRVINVGMVVVGAAFLLWGAYALTAFFK